MGWINVKLWIGGHMTRREERKLARVLADLNAALKQSLEVAESAVAALTETQALLDKSTANAELWRQLAEAAQRPASVSLPDEMKPVNWWVH
jgi:hypothetical protein